MPEGTYLGFTLGAKTMRRGTDMVIFQANGANPQGGDYNSAGYREPRADRIKDWKNFKSKKLRNGMYKMSMDRNWRSNGRGDWLFKKNIE